MSRPPSVQAHESVLDAALQLITRRGIDETSVDDLAEAAGVSKATIYKHWTSKEAVFLEAISRLKCDLPAAFRCHRNAAASGDQPKARSV
jgi:TetR/AcrR family transcriptional repressor of mexJK operon